MKIQIIYQYGPSVSMADLTGFHFSIVKKYFYLPLCDTLIPLYWMAFSMYLKDHQIASDALKIAMSCQKYLMVLLIMHTKFRSICWNLDQLHFLHHISEKLFLEFWNFSQMKWFNNFFSQVRLPTYISWDANHIIHLKRPDIYSTLYTISHIVWKRSFQLLVFLGQSAKD